MEKNTNVILLFTVHFIIFLLIYLLTLVCVYYTFIIKSNNFINDNIEDIDIQYIDVHDIYIFEKDKNN
jgi:hypothetical protein